MKRTTKTININDTCYLCRSEPASRLVSAVINDLAFNLPLCELCAGLNDTDLEAKIKKTVEE